MNFKIVDRFLRGKTGEGSKCEDRIVITNDFVCIIDGATSKSDIHFNGNTSGMIAGEILKEAIFAADKKMDYLQLTNYLTHQIYEFYVNNNLLERVQSQPRDRLIATVVVFSVFYNEIWMVGDCQCLVDGIYYTNTKLIDEINSKVRSVIIELELKKGKKIEEIQENDLGRKFILPILESQQLFQNAYHDNQLSYAVLDGFPIDDRKVKRIKLKDWKSIIIASDGYPMVFPSLNESESYLDFILKNDPLCYKIFKSTKGLYKNNLSFDDRAYLRIEKIFPNE